MIHPNGDDGRTSRRPSTGPPSLATTLALLDAIPFSAPFSLGFPPLFGILSKPGFAKSQKNLFTSSNPLISQNFIFISSHKLKTTCPQIQVLSIDWLNVVDALPIPDAHIYLPRVQFLDSLSDGLRNILYRFTAAFTCKSRPRGPTNFIHAPGTLDPLTLPATEPTRAGLLTVCAILKVGWLALLAALSFLLSPNLSDALFGDVLGALQSLA